MDMDYSRVLINISKSGITKGQHRYNSKSRSGLLLSKGIDYSIINLSDTEDLITAMMCNELFNPDKPDMFEAPV